MMALSSTIGPMVGSFRTLVAGGVLVGWALGCGVADAQALTAPDGQQFENQSARTRGDFTATFGASCAQQEWVWQHNMVVDADNALDGPAASDGQTLAAQDDDVQLAFVAWFGPQATA